MPINDRTRGRRELSRVAQHLAPRETFWVFPWRRASGPPAWLGCFGHQMANLVFWFEEPCLSVCAGRGKVCSSSPHTCIISPGNYYLIFQIVGHHHTAPPYPPARAPTSLVDRDVLPGERLVWFIFERYILSIWGATRQPSSRFDVCLLH